MKTVYLHSIIAMSKVHWSPNLTLKVSEFSGYHYRFLGYRIDNMFKVSYLGL